MQSQQLNSPSISQASSTNRIYKHFSDADRRSSELVTYLNKLPVAFNPLLKAVKITFALPASTASNDIFFFEVKRVKN